MKKILILIILLCTTVLGANELIHSDYDEYQSYLELLGKSRSPVLNYKTFSSNNWKQPLLDNPWASNLKKDQNLYKNDWMSLKLLDTELLLTANSAYNWGRNDGALWQGRGLNGRIQGGFSWETKYSKITFYPNLWFSQNSEYNILSTSSGSNNSFSSFHFVIDNVQRMGDKALLKFDLGQTDIRLNLGKFTMGVSNEEIWLGPGVKNALIIGNHGGGFLHFDFGFNKIDTIIGSFEVRLLWGLLEESDFFNDDPSDNFRLINLYTASYAPSFIPGLTLGANWATLTPGGKFDLVNFFLIPATVLGVYESNNTNDNDHRVSVTIDWKFPKSGFEVYSELALEDFNSTPIQTPDHTLFYTIGAKKAFQMNSKRGFLFNFELSNLGVSDSQKLFFDTLDGPNYYYHHRVIQGHTNKGQILGAAIGPGSDSQYLSVTYYDKWGKAKLFVERVNKDKTYVLKDYVAKDNPDLNVEVSLGLEGLIFAGPIDLFGSFVTTYEMSHLYIVGNNIWNFHGELGARYRY